MKQRLLHIDVLRGLCIFTVVYTHVIGFGMADAYPKTPIHVFLTSFFLIMFYFLSGMMSYRDGMLGDVRSLGAYVWKKIRTLLIPSIVVMGGVNLIVEHSLRTMLSPWNLWVTWFTYVLFLIAVIFGVVIYLSAKFKMKYIHDLFLIMVAGLSYLLSRKNLELGELNLIFRIGGVLYYLPFFFLGALCKRNPLILSFLRNQKVVLFLTCALTAISFSIDKVPLFVKNILVISAVYTVVQSFCLEVQNKIEANSMMDAFYKKTINFLSLLGRYSLEIYFVHFLFLFQLPAALTEYIDSLTADTCWWGHSSASFVEFCIIGSISMLIALASIFSARILVQIPFLDMLLFGKKHN